MTPTFKDFVYKRKSCKKVTEIVKIQGTQMIKPHQGKESAIINMDSVLEPLEDMDEDSPIMETSHARKSHP